MSGLIPHNRPLITPADRAAVDTVLASGWIAQGPAVAALESDFVRHYGSGDACAVSSGTAALYLALRALGAGPGSSVAVPTYACTALLNAVIMAGATARPVDVLPESFCLDVGKMRVQASDARIAVTVHCFGASADVASLRALGVRVIEDCCQGLGGASGGLPVGAAGHAAVFSFYATKIVTGGQGGMVWAPDPGVTAAVRDFRQFDGRERYEPRFNFQMTDLQAALAHSQLGRIESIRARRHQIAAAYLAALPRGLAAQAGLLSPGRMVQRFVVVAPSAAIRDALRTQMTAAGVGCIVPVERFELLHRCLGLDPSGYAAAERLADTTLSLPLHLSLGEDEVARVCAALREFRP